MRRAAAAALASLAVGALTTTGCDDPRECTGPFVTLRNPSNLACVARQLASPDCPDIPPSPPWPACKHPCEAISDEAACIAQSGCRVARELCDVFDDRCDREGPFISCFPIGTGAAAAGTCAELDVAACATREDCGAQYLHGPECPQPPGADRAAPDGPDCRFSFVTCFDERSPP